jgi:hypothetical protein
MYYHDQQGQKQRRLLKRDIWHGQMHGKRGPFHSRFMRPHCDMVPDGEGQSFNLGTIINRARRKRRFKYVSSGLRYIRK